MGKKQNTNGKALEYCFAETYFTKLSALGLNVTLLSDKHYLKTKKSYDSLSLQEQNLFLLAAETTFSSMIKIEPGLTNQIDATDNLQITIAADAEGKIGDVRDVLFKRKRWQIGFSVKNNHDAAKHSRLSPKIDFGKEWMGNPCSQTYFNEINLVFTAIHTARLLNPLAKWSAYPNKFSSVYSPVLEAFKKEISRLNTLDPNTPKKILAYLIGRNSFYKITKIDNYNLVVVKGYNMNRDLAKIYNATAAVCRIPPIIYPTRIIDFVFNKSKTTLLMTLDKGWQISFRIHSANTLLEESLKFDIVLIGNPPILFNHYTF